MTEFNSASCGGVPNVSDTFAVGSLWTADYALQLASLGYTAAYIHTRERGTVYNVVESPDGPAGSSGAWTTLPPYYALLAVSEALMSENGSIVVDLHIGNVQGNPNSTVAAYAVYHAANSTVNRVVLFNYANGTASQFTLPADIFPGSVNTNVTVKYLTAPNALEKIAITWGGGTFAGAGDGEIVPATGPGTATNQQLDCSKGCTVNVPGPGMALVSVGASFPNIVRPRNGANMEVLSRLMIGAVMTITILLTGLNHVSLSML
jgi:hypothetical protein